VTIKWVQRDPLVMNGEPFCYGSRLTVRQLLDHTSGLPDFFLNGKIDRALVTDRARKWTTRDSFRYVGKPIFPAGKGWYYSNTNYALLALVAEAVDDRPLSEQLRSRFLDPLGLDHTYEQIDERPAGRGVPHHDDPPALPVAAARREARDIEDLGDERVGNGVGRELPRGERGSHHVVELHAVASCSGTGTGRTSAECSARGRDAARRRA